MFLASICMLMISSISASQTNEKAGIFPCPQKMQLLPEQFVFNEQTIIAITDNPNEHDKFLASFLCAEFCDRYGIPVQVKTLSHIAPEQKAILIGSADSPLIKTVCGNENIDANIIKNQSEGYVLRVSNNRALIMGGGDAGTFYGLQSLRQLIRKDNNSVSICGVDIQDWPYKSFRGIKVYMPGKNNLKFFKRFLSNFMAKYKYNKLILEVSPCMRFERHPEINAGWLDLVQDLKYSRRERPAGPKGQIQDSANYDAGDGEVVEQQDVADIVQYARQHHIEVIPEIPSLTHSYYLLTRHRELAEVQDAEWPDTYCPLNRTF